MKLPTGIWGKLDVFSPPAVRLLATKRGRSSSRMLTDEEIAEQGGLRVSRVQEIYWSKDWEEVPVRDAKRFFLGCGFDLDNPRDVEFLSRRLIHGKDFKWRHLQRSSNHKQWEALLRFAVT